MFTPALSSVGSIAPVYKSTIPPCSDGGIIEPPLNKPVPGAIEEKPTTIDPKTGERVYVDEYLKDMLKPHVCYLV